MRRPTVTAPASVQSGWRVGDALGRQALHVLLLGAQGREGLLQACDLAEPDPLAWRVERTITRPTSNVSGGRGAAAVEVVWSYRPLASQARLLDHEVTAR